MTEKCKACGSCGMPLLNKEDFGGADMINDYCVHCTDGDGKLTATFEGIVSYYADEFQKEQGLDKTEARKMAAETVSKLPAWSN